MAQKAPSDLPLDAALFRRKSAWEFFPAVDYDTPSPRARRNSQASGTGNSMLLVKALLTALTGKIDRALTDHSAFFYVSAQSLSGGKGSYVAMKTNPLTIQSFYGSTYHIGTLFLLEAIERGPAASDLIVAWADLVEFAQTSLASALGHPLRWEDLATLTSSAFNDALLRAADELYYWTRYEDATSSECVANGPHDRLPASAIERVYPKPSAGADDLTPLLLDPVKLRERANAPTTTQPSSAAPANAFAGFYGPQLKQLVDAITRHVPTLLYGPTGTGKTTCEIEAMTQLVAAPKPKGRKKAAPLALGHERVDGKEGLEDIDLLGAIVPQGNDRVWVDGPLARAFRRAQAEKVVLFVDEITTIPTAHVNILKGALNPTPQALLELQGIVPQGNSPSRQFYFLEITQTTEILTAPVENLAVVAACNLGSQYAVHPLDPALERRFQFHIEFGYLPIQDEANLIAERTGLVPNLALACARVAAKTREKAENAEVADGLDPASLLVWAGEIARANPKNAATAQKVFVETARYTWLPRVVGRDHRGLVLRAKAQGIEDAISDQAQNAFAK